MTSFKIVLDSNEYVFYLTDKNKDILKLLNLEVKIFLNNLIFKEVVRNIRKESVKQLIKLLKNPKFAVNADKILDVLIEKYRNLGLKKGGIIIAAFCESVNASFLISENRHFLKEVKFDRFKVVKLSEFLAAWEGHSKV